MSRAEDPVLEAVVARVGGAPADQASWEEFFTAFWPLVLAASSRQVGRASPLSDAEDVASEALSTFAVQVRSQALVVRTARQTRVLLRLLVGRAARDRARRLDATRRAPESAGGSAALEKVAAPSGEGPEAAAEMALLLDCLHARLTLQEWEVFRYRHEGYEVVEIAERLGLSARTVKRTLARIRQVVAQCLGVAEEGSPGGQGPG